MNYRIVFADGTLFPCLSSPIAPVKKSQSGDREWRHIVLNSTYNDVQTKFINNAQYSLQWDSAKEDGTIEVLSEVLSEYCIAGPITDTRNGSITVDMGKKTQREIDQEEYDELMCRLLGG
jgi:hypothetical protein